MDKNKIKSFTDLRVWRESHTLVIEIYETTCKWPTFEMYGLTNQIRRACVSVVSNIAEGFSRQSSKEKVHFFYIAKASLAEVHCQLLISKDLGYIKQESLDVLVSRCNETSKMLYGLIKVINKTSKNSV